MRGFRVKGVDVRIITVLVLLFVALLFPIPYTITPTHAQTCSQSGTPIANGLVSAPSLSKNLTNSSGACVIDPKAAFSPLTLPTYDNLKSLYFDQSKAPKDASKFSNPTNPVIYAGTVFSGDKVWYADHGLQVIDSPKGSGTQVIFVNGDLTIISDIFYADTDPNSGLVFVVKGNVNISTNVKKVDAIIISGGTICTAYNGINCPNINVTASQLIINGSLISLNQSAPIQFKRVLTTTGGDLNSTNPAEKINHQVKYLVLLRNLMSDTFQRWTELDGSLQIPYSQPTPTPSPTPAPTIYSLPNNWNPGIQGPTWYFYNRTSSISPMTWGPNPWAWWDSSSAWYKPNSWATIRQGTIVADNGTNSLIYFKAPSKGIADTTITVTQPYATDGDGFNLYVKYTSAVGGGSETTLQQLFVAGNDNGTKTFHVAPQMQGNGDAILLEDNDNTSPYHDDANYTFQVTFTKN